MLMRFDSCPYCRSFDGARAWPPPSSQGLKKGIGYLAQLAIYSAEEIAGRVAAMLRTHCWKNSPQTKAAVTAAIGRVKAGL